MKILFYDSWLKGVRNFTRLMPELGKYPDVQCRLVHTASWKGEVCETDQIIDGLRCIDISAYGTNSLSRVIERESPDVLVTLNMYSFVDRTLVAVCRHLGVRIIYLSHGRFSLGAPSDLSSLVEKRRRNKSLREKFNKENRMMFGNYALSTLQAGRPLRFVRAMWQYFTDPAQRSVNTPYNRELLPDKILLYYQSDKKVMTEHRHFPDNNIYVVGNPELDDFIDTPIVGREMMRQRYGLSDTPYLLYLDDGLLQNQLMQPDVWKHHIGRVNALARSRGWSLVIKLHPRTDAASLTSFFDEEGIVAYQHNIDFKSLIGHSEAVTSIFSSTIAFALLLGKRVVSPRWEETAGFPKSYPADVIRYATSEEDFAKALEDTAPTCTDAAYVADNFGDLSQRAIPRIVRHIIS